MRPVGGLRIDLLRDRDEGHVPFLEGLAQLGEVAERTRQTVDFVGSRTIRDNITDFSGFSTCFFVFWPFSFIICFPMNPAEKHCSLWSEKNTI